MCGNTAKEVCSSSVMRDFLLPVDSGNCGQGGCEGENSKKSNQQTEFQSTTSPTLGRSRLRVGENTDEKGADEKLSHEVPEMKGQQLA
ncbi:hypothetical protein TNCV_2767991 [Trichonephila clavipes]|nr:hypothetical protein TNCV_2767991 [Trichonephila clavipes]